MQYSEQKPRADGAIQVGPIHTLTYRLYGSADVWERNNSVVYLHGGPGAGSAPYFHRFFDPAFFNVIVHEQRGAPEAKPWGIIEDNSPDELIEDCEALRRHLGIEKWHVFGGSWGSTLALLYAEKYPTRVCSLTLRGVFLMRDEEIEWFLAGMGRFFPEAWDEFANYVGKTTSSDILESYFRQLMSPDPDKHDRAARAWVRYENGCSFRTPLPDAERTDPMKDALCMARVEAHFFLNHKMRNRILDEISSIRHIPTMIVQGRYDVVCPPKTAFDLRRELHNCCLQLVETGHSAKEPEIMKCLIAAADRIVASTSEVQAGVPVFPMTFPASSAPKDGRSFRGLFKSNNPPRNDVLSVRYDIASDWWVDLLGIPIQRHSSLEHWGPDQ